MITKLSIRNFKSIKELDIDCARVNLFIGEPNTGKSNILEALGLLSWCASADLSLKDFVRFEYMQNLLYANSLEHPFNIEICGDMEIAIVLQFDPKENSFSFYQWHPPKEILVPSGSFIVEEQMFINELDAQNISNDLQGVLKSKKHPISETAVVQIEEKSKMWLIKDGSRIYLVSKQKQGIYFSLLNDPFYVLDHLGTKGSFKKNFRNISQLQFVKFYRYKEQNTFPIRSSSWLVPPYGPNLLTLVMTRKELYETISNFFSEFDFKITSRPHDDTFEFFKDSDKMIINYPYILASDTLKRMVFFSIAIDSNKNSTLVFEEPEVHAFPSYIKQLGEKIAFDESNQYFIVTHNPYLFLSIVENVPKKEDVNVFITYMKDYQTKVKMADEKEFAKLMRYDPFFNLLHMIEEEK